LELVTGFENRLFRLGVPALGLNKDIELFVSFIFLSSLFEYGLFSHI